MVLQHSLLQFTTIKNHLTRNLSTSASRKSPFRDHRNTLSGPGITRAEFKQRRDAFARAIPEGSFAIVSGYSLRYSTGSIFYPFHQNTDLLYLTGFNEADGAMILEKNSQKYPSEGYKFTMFVKPRDPSTEIWDGPRCGTEGALSELGAHDAQSIHRLPTTIQRILDTQLPHMQSQIITDLPTSFSFEPPGKFDSDHAASAPSVPSWTPFATLLSYLSQSNPQKPLNLFKVVKLNSRNSILPRLRVVKSQAEIAILRKSGQVSGRAVAETMAATKPGVSEAYLHGVMEFGVRKRGADGLAYVPVVATGKNALTLHYVVNRGVSKDGDLVLMDAGGEYGGYASDITRTWPVNGKFTEPQRNLYQAVLKVQKACIEKCTEKSCVTLDDLQDLAFELLRVECSKLFGRRLSYKDMNILYPHHIGHWMGLDVHDVQSIPRSTQLTEGMVVTIEPGIYVPYSDAFPERYRGIGIRIEDDIAVGKNDYTVLTAEAPKEIEDIEAVCNGLVKPKD